MRAVLRNRKYLAAALLAALLAGCGGTRPIAPVEERAAAPTRRINHHVVAAGETLYSIAWRYGLDYRELARLNRLDSRYTLHPGQRLALDVSEAPAVAAVPQRQSTAPSRAPVSAAPIGSASGAPLQWKWPAHGAIVQRFGSGHVPHKGIDIRGNLGEPVTAAAAGTVVYAGSGLVGYGNLVIVKHNDRYLSAYGHNSHLWVVEGQQIKGGDRIADIGDSGTDSPMLHFEMRLDGQPVDPVSLLPRR